MLFGHGLSKDFGIWEIQGNKNGTILSTSNFKDTNGLDGILMEFFKALDSFDKDDSEESKMKNITVFFFFFFFFFFFLNVSES